MVRRLAFLLAACVYLQSMTVGYAFAAAAAADEMDVQVWAGAQPGQAIVIVGTTLPQDVELPATVRLPVLAGTTVDWAGEIGESTDQDVQREFTLEEGVGGQYAEFEVSGARNAQVELSGIPLTATADGFSAKVTWVQTVPAAVTKFSMRLPAGISQVVLDPAPAGQPQTNDAGETLYTLPSKELAEGGQQALSLSYTTGAGSASGNGGGVDTRTVVGVLFAVLVVLGAVLAYVLTRRRPA